MKKIFALILSIALMLFCASASARTAFDANREKIHFVVLAYDDETDETFTAVWTFKTVISRIEKSENFFELLAMECDSFIPCRWEVDVDGNGHIYSTLDDHEITPETW